MIEYIPTIWLLSAFLIPIVLILIGVKNLYKKVHFMEVLATLFYTFLLYFPVTFIAFWYIAALINSYAHTKSVHPTSSATNTYEIDWVTYELFFAYIIFGLILFWLGNQGLIKIITFFYNKVEKLDLHFERK